MIEFQISSPDNLLAEKVTAIIQDLRAKVDWADALVQQRAQEKASGDVLKNHTGNLLRSIEMIPAVIEGDQITGEVQGGGGVAPYLKFQELGTNGPYEIVPVNKQALAFMLDGKQVFAKHVMHPGLPVRSVLYASLDELSDEIVAGLQEAVSG